MKRADGFTLVEVLVAATILIVGILTALAAMDASRKLSLVAERRTTLLQRAQLELERVKSLPYSQVALTGTSTAWSTTAGNYTYVSDPAGTCPGAPSGAAPTYQPDHSTGGSTATEPVVINGCTLTIDGTSTAVSGGTVVPYSTWTDGTVSGATYDFVTLTNDPTCAETTVPGSVCATSNDYKRITVVVAVSGAAQPSTPVIVSGYIANPNSSTSSTPSPTCINPSTGVTQTCFNTPPGTENPLSPCDTSASSSSCGTPGCSGNTLHETLVKWGLGLLNAPMPDLMQTDAPTGNCLTNGTPTPPCYATDVTGCTQGLPITPAGTSCGTSPPLNNAQSHSWVTSPMYTGASMNLNGYGSMTAYLMSGNGVAANVTVCLGLYVVPGGILGTLTGNLLSTPIGVVVSAQATAQVGVWTPVNFTFNTGTADNVTGSLLGTRVEIVVWIAASAGTQVDLGYDQANVASQFVLMTS